MKKILFGFIIGFLVPFAAAYLFLISGGMPVATKSSSLPLEKYIAGVAIHAAMDRELNKPSPIAPDETNLTAGARVYQAQCLVCHGSLDQPATAIARGMFPAPPPLVRMDKKGVTDDSAGESYWKIKNGIRLTGMPGYVDSLSETELWQVSLLLQHAHELPPAAQQILSGKLNGAANSAMQ